MIADFEQRLVQQLGTRLPEPLTGRVFLAPASPQADQVRLSVGVRRCEALKLDLGQRRPEVVPGAESRRRVLRLRCTVEIQLVTGENLGRSEEVAAVDTLAYLLDSKEFRTGAALAAEDGDPGFHLERLELVDTAMPLAQTPDEPSRLTLRAEGWFWPIDVAGETGIAIGEIRVRSTTLPVTLLDAPARWVAGGEAVGLRLRLGHRVGTRLGDEAPLSFSSVMVTLRAPDGGAGAGTLGGGTEGPAGARVLSIDARHEAALTYTPPAEASTDQLVFALERAGELGLELGRFEIDVQEGG